MEDLLEIHTKKDCKLVLPKIHAVNFQEMGNTIVIIGRFEPTKTSLYMFSSNSEGKDSELLEKKHSPVTDGGADIVTIITRL